MQDNILTKYPEVPITITDDGDLVFECKDKYKAIDIMRNFPSMLTYRHDYDDVVKGLTECIKNCKKCIFDKTDCPYIEDCKKGGNAQLLADALRLIQEQKHQMADKKIDVQDIGKMIKDYLSGLMG